MTDQADPDPDLGVLPITYSIVGVQKAATTTLSAWLGRHRQVARAERKELHFFDREDLDWEHPDYSSYVAVKRAPHQRVAGDASPNYLWWPRALERMQAYNPEMRLIASFRDPIERLFSHWTMLWARAPQHAPDWPVFITRHRPRATLTALPPTRTLKRFRHLSGVVRGYYGGQLERGLELFPREQWLLLEFRSLLSNKEATLGRLTSFLGLHRYHEIPLVSQWMAGPSQVSGTPPTGEDVSGLVELYAEDHARFVRLSGLEVGHWPLARVLAGTLEPAEVAERLAAKVTWT